MGTPDGQQALGFLMYQRELKERLGLTFEMTTARSLAEVERALIGRPADVAFFMVHWSERVEHVIEAVERIRAARPDMKLVFVDYYAPTCSPHFPLAAHVDCYAKRQVFADMANYQREYEGGYVFAEFMARRFGHALGDWYFGSRLDPAHAHKVVPAWNLGVTPRYRRLLGLTRRLNWAWRFRPIHINRRFGLPPSGAKIEWYQEYRSIALDRLAPLEKEYRCSGAARVGSKRYFAELAASQVVFSPFGWGELCFRDYEAVACGAILVKPSMGHLSTSPDIFRAHETYVPVQWDMSDLEETCRRLLADVYRSRSIAANAQRAFHKYLMRGGFVADIQRLLSVAAFSCKQPPVQLAPASP